MEHSPLPQALCLTELLDQDLTAYEYYQTLPTQVRERLGDDITSFESLQAQASRLSQLGEIL